MQPIPIVFENHDFIVINKPPGIGVHQEKQLEGVVTAMQKQLGFGKLWLVHRLDKVTSGLLVLGKSAESTARLSKLFAQRKIQKYYFAISDRKPKKKQGNVMGDMRVLRDGKWALSKTLNNPAIGQFFSCSMGNGFRFFVIKPHTGKTHQIRVMMKSLSSPILGDNLYTGSSNDRVYLHAYMLQFSDLGTDYQLRCFPQSGSHFKELQERTIPNDYFTPEQLSWPAVRYRLPEDNLQL